ncbi:hypothetical protein [Deferrisoma palaeochoriense]
MPKRKILSSLEAVYDEDGVVFYCDGEPVEDMEFSWEDLFDEELRAEAAEELAEYVEADELEDVDNPVQVILSELAKLLRTPVARKAYESFEEEDDEEDLDEEDEDLDEDED